jgi:hypothetical protein
MTWLPIVERELRVRSRHAGSHWARCGLAGVATLLVLQCTMTLSQSIAPALIGAATFSALSWLALIAACLSGLVTADCLSAERREGTLGLLFLTQIKSPDVVLGKLAAYGLSAFYGLLSFLPGLALALLSGGISGGRLARTGLALLNVLFVSLAIGILVSAREQSQLKAMRNALLVTGFFFSWAWVVAHIRPMTVYTSALFGLINPYASFFLAPDSAYVLAPGQFWQSLCVGNLLGWVMLIGATGLLKRDGLGMEKAAPPRKRAEPQMVQSTGNEAAITDRLELLEKEPVCWAVTRLQGHNVFLWAGGLLLLLSGAWGSLLRFGSSTAAPALYVVSLLMNAVAGALLAWGAGRSLFQARRSGELELLLSTPLGAQDIIRGHWWALWRPLRGAWLLVVFVLFLQFLYTFPTSAGPQQSGRTLYSFGAAMVPINKVMDGVALCWVGMWFGFQARKAFPVIGWTVGLVIVLPWIAWSVGSFFHSGRYRFAATTAELILWFAIGSCVYLAKNIFLIAWAARKLRGELRATAPLALGEWLK